MNAEDIASNEPSVGPPPWLEHPEDAKYWVRISEAARMLRVSKATAKRWFRNGYLNTIGMPTYRHGFYLYVKVKPFHLDRQ